MYVGLSNPEEFSFTSDEETQEQTIRRAGHHARDQKRLDTLKKKLHTDDERKNVVVTWCVIIVIISLWYACVCVCMCVNVCYR